MADFYRVGKSYVPIIVSAFALILGTFEISNLTNLGINLFYQPVYWLSIFVVTLAIFLQYLVHNRLESQVENQELRIKILELENELKSLQE